jgi:multidrug efflux system membrane fusion protein
VLATRKDAVVVPNGAVQIGQKGPHLFVVGEDLIAHDKLVQQGVVIGNETVIESGLAIGETVVVDGQMQLVEGAKVRTRESSKEGRPEKPATPPAEEKERSRS